MNKIGFQIFFISLMFLFNSCCKESDYIVYINIKYPKLGGYASKYKVSIIRTVRGDFSKAIDTANVSFNKNYNIELNFKYSKETLPENPVNMPDFIIKIYLRATNTNNLTQDSLLYQDSISNIQYEVSRCNVENWKYEFNGNFTESREIIVEN